MSGKQQNRINTLPLDQALPDGSSFTSTLKQPATAMSTRSGRIYDLRVSDADPRLAEPEPRRSVRTTKGQHTKLDEPEPPAPKKRQTKKSKKAQEQQEQEQDGDGDSEDVIRCICGFDQDEDPNEAFIGCETCMVWQHNICMGISTFDDEIPESYWCEQCRPEDHKELLDALKKGEKLWEERRRIHEEENKKKKKKGGRKSKSKRVSDAKEEVEKEPEKEKEKEKEAPKSKPKSSPAPAPAPEPVPKEKKEPAKGKRKTREDSNDVEAKVRFESNHLYRALLTMTAECQSPSCIDRTTGPTGTPQVYTPIRPCLVHL